MRLARINIHLLVVLCLLIVVPAQFPKADNPKANDSLLSGPPLAQKEDTLSSGADEKLPGPNEFVAVDVPPRLLESVYPKYPPRALREHKTGEVWVRILIDKSGTVRRAYIETPSGQNCGFEEAALEAAYKRKYEPALYEGYPTPCWLSYQVGFFLKK